MKIYTRTGDDGTTGLFGGDRVRKSDLRLDCCGTLDELNAAIGLAAASAPQELIARLRQVQNELFVIGAHLATLSQSPSAAALPPIEEAMITRLEMEIDTVESKLPNLRNFILPGGGETAARLHVARTICRRAERLLVGLSLDRPVDRALLTYVNRLSDWLFVHARLSNHRQGVADVPWTT